jgi:hypothetical protein
MGAIVSVACRLLRCEHPSAVAAGAVAAIELHALSVVTSEPPASTN